MRKMWRNLSSKELNDYKQINQENFGVFRPTIIQRILIFVAQKTFFKRGHLRRLITHLTYSIRKAPLDIYFRQCSYRLHFNRRNHIQFGLLANPKYNFRDIEFLLKGSNSTSNFVDIGANIGLYCQPLARNSPKGQVIAIDANPLMIQQLNFNAKASNLKNLTIIFSAVSNKTGYGSLKINNDDDAIVALNEENNDGIPVRTLKDILTEHKIREIYGLKIDVEGHEDLALAPFLLSAAVDELPAKIVIECATQDQYPACKAAFKKLNYKFIGRSKNNWFYQLSQNLDR